MADMCVSIPEATGLASGLPNMSSPQYVIWNDLVGGTVQGQKGYGTLTTMSSDGRYVAYQTPSSGLEVWNTLGIKYLYQHKRLY